MLRITFPQLRKKYSVAILFLSSTTILFSNPLGKRGQGICGLDLVELYANHNSKITDVSFMKRLQILHIRGNCGICQKSIYNLNLTELDANNNPKNFLCKGHD